MSTRKIYTIGHSTRSFEALIRLLQNHGIETIADIRRFPTSRKHPQFKRAALEAGLRDAGLTYRTLGELLGGYRSGGYRTYMATESFRHGLAELEALAEAAPTAFMCAEIVPFRCHRRFVADALLKRGWEVIHIIEAGRIQPHRLTTSA